ncbi:Stf0 family sulfotransferase [Mesorhizobium erdmanii]|uniref:Stf0 family sulfotransferase n=1 Tax=Mesorhizobium erdmanii TaxID=1777866 RepID=UPI0014955BCF|nr:MULTISPECIES: Stf0 family sulfotransferase [Mesorhizobium]
MTLELVGAGRRRGSPLTEMQVKESASADSWKFPIDSRDALQRAIGEIEQSYSIAFAPRCGSNYLCELLTLAGIGRPTEYFQYDLPHWKVPDIALAVSNVFQQNTVDGVFGAKVAHDHCAWFQSAIGKITGRNELLGDLLPNHKWLRLVRKDKVAQAMSLYRAQLTQEWLKWQDDSKSNGDIPYDFLAIVACYHTVVTAELAWDVYFSEYGIEPLVVTYEDLAERPHQTVAAIAAYLTLENWRSVEGVDANLRVQRDENTAPLIAQFRQALIDVGRLPD